MSKPTDVKQVCATCNCETNHDIMYNYEETGPDEYMCQMIWMVVQCRGCERISFRYEFHDWESSYPISNDPNGEWDYDIEVDCYPTFIEGHLGIDHTGRLPDIVREIYRETIEAVKSGSFTLSAIGLRATIESICNEQNIKGSNLSTRINKLATNGIISKKDAERLHVIRFMGNDAAHDIQQAKRESVLVALSIIEYLLQSLYLFDSDVAAHFKMPISSYDDFKHLIDNLLDSTDTASRFTIISLLGENRKRLLTSIETYESKLRSEINSGSYKRMRFAGKIQIEDQSKESYQKVEQARESDSEANKTDF